MHSPDSELSLLRLEFEQHMAACRQCTADRVACASAKFLLRAYNNARRRGSA